MAFQPTPPGCIEVVFRFQLFGIPLVIVIYVCLDAGHTPSPTELANVAGACNSWMTADMMPILSRDLTLQQVQATDTSSITGAQVTLDHIPGTAGGIAQPSLPSQVAVVCTLYTALRGRSFRGRSFIPGIPLGYQDVDANSVSTAGVSNITNSYNALDTRLTPIAAHQEVMSRTASHIRRVTAVGTPVTTRVVNNRFDTLRRRGANAHV